MTVSFALPDNYGYVVLTTVVGQFVASFYMGTIVQAARESLNVPYPNLYATPKHHPNADAFNRVQRGHQAMFETLPTFSLMALIGGLKDPIISSVCSIMYLGGSVLYQKGYADTSLDVKFARYKKGGLIKWFGVLGAMGTVVHAAGSFNGWW